MADILTHADSIRRYYSGAASDGGSQTLESGCLGNYASATELPALVGSISSAISGISVDYIAGLNGIGSGSLAASSNTNLTWTPPGGTAGAAVTINNGESKVIEGGIPGAYLRVSRISASNLTGTATITTSIPANNVIGATDVTGAQSAAGLVRYRCIVLKNVASQAVNNLYQYVAQLGTARVSGSTQLGASGAGTLTIATGTFNDWPASGFCRIETSANALREIVYYSSRTSTALTVPSAGRGKLGSTAAAGAATDNVYAVPGIRIGKDPNYPAQTIANETTAPTGVTWVTGVTAANGVNTTTLAAGAGLALWFEETIVAGATGLSIMQNGIAHQFDA